MLLLTLTGCGARQAKTERKGQNVSITEEILQVGGTDTVRFGRMHSGEIAQLRLWLSNHTEQPVVILSYERSCGCTALEHTKEPIRPGEAQQVTLTFDTRGEWGWQLRTLDISIAGAQKPLRLFVEAEVE
ncbi:DUF1573 domain-containing protein [uncultured Alistipes sp.]|uniref:DUF1573 domain-containing protein n=1 Tax=uncultured Alistipes sp. TaxID=538949 RepID=UPI0025D83F88|nr:DUF1573 domain-containing protein [uncultured Alistipes sp.]